MKSTVENCFVEKKFLNIEIRRKKARLILVPPPSQVCPRAILSRAPTSTKIASHLVSFMRYLKDALTYAAEALSDIAMPHRPAAKSDWWKTERH